MVTVQKRVTPGLRAGASNAEMNQRFQNFA